MQAAQQQAMMQGAGEQVPQEGQMPPEEMPEEQQPQLPEQQ